MYIVRSRAAVSIVFILFFSLYVPGQLAQPGPNGPGRDGPPDQAAPPGCRPSGIGRVNVVTNVRGVDQGASAGPDHGRDGPARWRKNVVTNIFFEKAVDTGAGSGII